jgi:predicted NAD/FAD-binding protein
MQSFQTQYAEFLMERKLSALNDTTLTIDGCSQRVGDFLKKQAETPPKPHDSKLPVAIIGAGAAGLRAAMLLQKNGIPYRIFEASKRHGGRLFTYHFTNDETLPHDYFDVGAMRYPDNPAMEATFKLFKELDIKKEGGKGGKLIPYHISTDSNYLLFNGTCAPLVLVARIVH